MCNYSLLGFPFQFFLLLFPLNLNHFWKLHEEVTFTLFRFYKFKLYGRNVVCFSACGDDLR